MEYEIIESRNLLEYNKDLSIDRIKKILKENKLSGISFDIQFKDEVIPSINFIKEIRDIKALQISTLYEYDLSVISELKELEFLRINDHTDSLLNLSGLSKLKALDLESKQNHIGLENCYNLEKLRLEQQKIKDLKQLGGLTRLKELTINSCSINSLKGIENLKKLETLALDNCRSLKDISPLNKINQLKQLSFNLCPKVYDYSLVGSLSDLKLLEITDCKQIKSLDFLANIKALNKISILGTSVIEDDNTIPLKRIPNVFYRHRKEYNEEIVNPKHEKIKNSNMKLLKKIFYKDKEE